MEIQTEKALEETRKERQRETEKERKKEKNVCLRMYHRKFYILVRLFI